MSTFKGVVDEFPDIRIDYFRDTPGKRPPLARFLSHVHSDHLLGLEVHGGSFIYCSPATKELLIRLEKYYHRINFEQGYLESAKQHYKHLKSRLRTIPLNTPTDVELELGTFIRVTLLDANHCAGAVMFLIEDNAKAILYTGDIRSEPWWVNSLIRNPVVLPYSHGHKRLDKIYLDTTFATKNDLYRQFPTKSAGLAELLEKVAMYPESTVFHFNAWTLGYEDVWIALSSALRSQVHIDQYKCRLYRSLACITAGENYSYEGSALFGFPLGNRDQVGCLTENQEVRLHSCERGSKCSTMDKADVVYITPIIARSAAGQVLPEIGAGGGGNDLIQSHDLALDNLAEDEVEELKKLCTRKIRDSNERLNTLDIILKAIGSQKQALSLDALGLSSEDADMPLAELAKRLARLADRGFTSLEIASKASDEMHPDTLCASPLSREIQFPYSRHSSYEELYHLLNALKPLDIYPCTVDEEHWDWNVSIEFLFGHVCSGTIFAHDKKMEQLLASRKRTAKRRTEDRKSQISSASREGSVDSQPIQAPIMKSVDIPRYPSDPSSFHSISDGVGRIAKRQRISPPLVELGQEEAAMCRTEPSPERLIPATKLRQTRQSFERHHGLSIGRANVPNRTSIGSGRNAALVRNAPNPPRGTQAEIIELSDGYTFSLGDEDDDDVEPGAFLLDQLPEPESVPMTHSCSQTGPDTQVSLSDTAFESQGSHFLADETATARIQHRKEAYKAVKELSGIWEVEHALVSSRDEEELEL